MLSHRQRQLLIQGQFPDLQRLKEFLQGPEWEVCQAYLMHHLSIAESRCLDLDPISQASSIAREQGKAKFLKRLETPDGTFNEVKEFWEKEMKNKWKTTS